MYTNGRRRYAISTECIYVYSVILIRYAFVYTCTRRGPCLMDHKITNGRFLLLFSAKSRATNNGGNVPIIVKYDKKKNK